MCKGEDEAEESSKQWEQKNVYALDRSGVP